MLSVASAMSHENIFPKKDLYRIRIQLEQTTAITRLDWQRCKQYIDTGHESFMDIRWQCSQRRFIIA